MPRFLGFAIDESKNTIDLRESSKNGYAPQDQLVLENLGILQKKKGQILINPILQSNPDEIRQFLRWAMGTEKHPLPPLVRKILCYKRISVKEGMDSTKTSPHLRTNQVNILYEIDKLLKEDGVKDPSKFNCMEPGGVGAWIRTSGGNPPIAPPQPGNTPQQGCTQTVNCDTSALISHLEEIKQMIGSLQAGNQAEVLKQLAELSQKLQQNPLQPAGNQPQPGNVYNEHEAVMDILRRIEEKLNEAKNTVQVQPDLEELRQLIASLKADLIAELNGIKEQLNQISRNVTSSKDGINEIHPKLDQIMAALGNTNEFERRMQEKEAEIARLEAELAAAQEELRRQEPLGPAANNSQQNLQELERLRGEIAQKQAELDNLRTEKDAEIARLQAELAAAQELGRDAPPANNGQQNLQAELDRLRGELDGIVQQRNTNIASKNTQIGDLTARIAELEAQLGNTDATEQELRETIARLEQDLEGARNEITRLEGLAAEAERLRTALSELQQECDEYKRTHGENAQELQAQLENLQALLDEKDGQLREKDANLAELQGKLDDLNNRLQGLAPEDLIGQLEDYDVEIANLKAKLAELEEQAASAAELRNQIAALEAQLEEYKRTGENAGRLGEELATTRQTLQQEKNQQKRDCDSTINDLRRQIDTLNRERDDALRRLAEETQGRSSNSSQSRQDLQRLQSELDDARNRLAELEQLRSRIRTLESQVSTQSQGQAGQANELLQKQARIQELEQQLQQLQGQASLVPQLQQQVQQLQQQAGQVPQLQAQLKDLQAQALAIPQLQQYIQQLENDLEQERRNCDKEKEDLIRQSQAVRPAPVPRTPTQNIPIKIDYEMTPDKGGGDIGKCKTQYTHTRVRNDCLLRYMLDTNKNPRDTSIIALQDLNRNYRQLESKQIRDNISEVMNSKILKNAGEVRRELNYPPELYLPQNIDLLRRKVYDSLVKLTIKKGDYAPFSGGATRKAGKNITSSRRVTRRRR